MTLVVNAVAGPGAGKSTTSACLFGLMKIMGERCEYVQEYAKELVYDKDWLTLADQRAVAREQEMRQRRLLGQVDYIITDSPLPLGLVYAKPPYDQQWFEDAIWSQFDSYRNFTVYIERATPYQAYGRAHSEEESHDLDQRLRRMFDGRLDLVVPGDVDAPRVIYEALMARKGL